MTGTVTTQNPLRQNPSGQDPLNSLTVHRTCITPFKLGLGIGVKVLSEGILQSFYTTHYPN